MKRLFPFLAVVLAAFALVGCNTAPTGPAARLSTFDPAEYAPYAGKGTGRITGTAFLKTRGGDVKLGAGCTVSLNPVTNYSREFFVRTVMHEEPLQPADPRATEFNRLTVADATGSFEFTDLPAGEYYLSCAILWQAPGVFRGSTVTTGGFARAQVKVSEGGTTRAVVTQ